MRALGGPTGRDILRGVAIDARAFAVARHAEARLPASFERMTRPKPRAVQTGKPHAVEREARRQRGHDADAVTARTVPFAVTRRAEIARAGRPQPMFAVPIAVVHEVARRQGLLGRQIHMAPIAVARPPLILVLVASEADRHLGPQRFRPFYADLHVAAHAITLRGGHVRAVLEAQVSPRQRGSAAHVHLTVAIFAPTLVVRLGVAAHAVGGIREVHGIDIARGGNPFVARQAINPLENVGAMLERVRWLSSNAKNTGASTGEECNRKQD
jgi:hypothetical protein